MRKKEVEGRIGGKKIMEKRRISIVNNGYSKKCEKYTYTGETNAQSCDRQFSANTGINPRQAPSNNVNNKASNFETE